MELSAAQHEYHTMWHYAESTHVCKFRLLCTKYCLGGGGVKNLQFSRSVNNVLQNSGGSLYLLTVVSVEFDSDCDLDCDCCIP